MDIPNFITHYNRSEPFRSMSAVPKEKLSDVLKQLNETNAWGLNRFSDPEYLDRRLVAEQKMRDAFIAKGGKPTLNHPIYFFLGRNDQFEKQERNIGYRIHLESLPNDSVSFTYGDSMFSFHEDYRIQKGGGYLSELCPHIYKFDELPKIFSHPDYKLMPNLQIEAQVWVMPSVRAP